MSRLTLDFCGENYVIESPNEFSIGREADLSIDDNPYLHRTFLRIHEGYGMWWLANVGNLLSATVTDASGLVQAWLAPGAKLPIVFQMMTVMFSAGSTTYEFSLQADEDYFNTTPRVGSSAGTTTIMPITLTSTQRLLIVALAENVLRQSVPGRGTIPTSTDAAERLGWAMTTFNRKLDKLGVDGLRGGTDRMATNRRFRLVEYAIATHLVGVEDLVLLERDHG